MTPRLPALLALFLLPLAACSMGDAVAGRSAVRDSAGIRIVESTAPAWGEGEGWTVAAEPELDIGGEDADPARQLYQVSDALRLADGRIVVANGGTHELRVFSARGEPLARFGREGDGPGEFRSLASITALPGDTLAAWDSRHGRLLRFAPDGRFVRSASADTRTMSATLVGVFGDGSFAVRPGFSPDALFKRQGGEWRDTTLLLRFRGDGSAAGTLLRLAGGERFLVKMENGFSHEDVIFGRTTLTRAMGDRLVAGETGSYDVAEYDAAGKLVRRVRRAHTPVAVRPEDVERYHQDRVASADLGEAPPQVRAIMQKMIERGRDVPHRPTFPAFQDLRLDAEGNLWAQEYGRPGDEGPARWSVFGLDGRWLGTVETPAGLQVQRIGRDFVLGLARDEDDVEHVRLHRLTRTPAS